MADLKSLARPAVEGLVNSSEDQLYEELGKRLRMVQADPQAAGAFEPSQQDREKIELETLGFVDDLKSLGKQFFAKVDRQAYEVMCGTSPGDQKDRDALSNAFGLGKEAVAATLAGALVAQLGIAPILAAAVAALIVRLFFKPAYQEMCVIWKKKLPSE